MKTNMMAGVLTLTAGLASQMAFPTIALAKSTQSEPSFAKEFKLKSNLVRTKLENGTYSEGYINLYIDQTSYTPDDANQIHAEMTGYIGFSSAKGDYDSNFAGGDGNVLFDLVHKGDAKTYQIYGCSSTLTSCFGSDYQIIFNGPHVVLNTSYKSSAQFEIWSESQQKWEYIYSIDLNKQH